jgi:hypothetical protein
MYNERDGERWNWKYTYRGEDLLPYARRRLGEHQAVEAQLRDRLAHMVKDLASFHDDVKLQQLKQDVDRHSLLREQFEVFTHEFARRPKEQYVLKLGDVVFFGIHSDGFTSSESS